MRIFTLVTAFLFLSCSLQAGTNYDITGEWNGQRFQYNETKSAYETDFGYKYILKQEGKYVTGTSYIERNGTFATIALKGFVEGNKFYFEEYEVIDAKRREGFLWCLKKGVLTINNQEGIYTLSGTTPSYMEILGYECTGGVTILSKDSKELNHEEIQTIANESNLGKNFNVEIFPNPFVETTNVQFELTNREDVLVDVVDIQGRVVTTLVSQSLDKGAYNYLFKPQDHQSSYFIRFQVGKSSFSMPLQRSLSPAFDNR